MLLQNKLIHKIFQQEFTEFVSCQTERGGAEAGGDDRVPHKDGGTWWDQTIRIAPKLLPMGRWKLWEGWLCDMWAGRGEVTRLFQEEHPL